MSVSQALVRKQFLVTKSNVKKIESIAKKQGASATEIVRKAIESFDPDSLDQVSGGEQELLNLAVEGVNEAIKATRKTRLSLDKTLKKLSASNI